MRRFSRAAKVANLDFEARVPVPFSIFPSTYRDSEAQTTIQQTHEEVDIKLPNKQPAGREGQYSSYTANVDLPPRGEHHFSEEEVRFTREEERYRRPGFQHEQYVKEERRYVFALSLSLCRPLSLFCLPPLSVASASRAEAPASRRPRFNAADAV